MTVLDGKRTPMVRDTEDEIFLRLGYPDGLRVETEQPLTAFPIDAESDLPAAEEKNQ
jgi:hypothetical protein